LIDDFGIHHGFGTDYIGACDLRLRLGGFDFRHGLLDQGLSLVAPLLDLAPAAGKSGSGEVDDDAPSFTGMAADELDNLFN